MRFLIFFLLALFILDPTPSAGQSFLVGQVDQNGQTNAGGQSGSVSSSGNQAALSSIANGFLGQDAAEGGSFVNQYSEKYKKINPDDLAKIRSQNIFSPSHYLIQFVRHPDDAYGIVTLRLQSPMIIQGCGTAQIGRINIEHDGRTLKIAMDQPELVPAAQMRYPHYECKVTNGTPTVDIPLSRNELIANRIETINVKAGNAFDSYKVHFGDTSMTLEPLSSNVFRPYDRPNALHHVFYPVNMIILRAPAAAHDEQLAQKMNSLAKRHKLIPIDTPIPNAKPYQFYAIDKDYNVMLPLKRGILKNIDTIRVDETFQGKDGPYIVSRRADVYVGLPGEFD